MNVIPEAAKWRGGPSRERIEQIQRDFYYDGNCDAWKGRKIGKTYGGLFHVNRVAKRLIPVQYDSLGRVVIELMPRRATA